MTTAMLRNAKTPRTRLGYLISIAIASLMVGLAIVGIYGYDELSGAQQAQAQAIPSSDTSLLPVQALTVHREEGYELEEYYAGRLVSRRHSKLGFERPGILVEVAVDEGMRVEQGELLARLDDRRLAAKRRELEAKLEHSRATHKEIVAQFALDEVTTQRLETQLKSRGVSRQRYDESVFKQKARSAELAAASAAIKREEAAIQILEADMAHSIILAPFAGSIVARLADEGTAMEPGQPVLEIMEDGILEVRVGVPVEAVSGLRRGRTYPIEVDKRIYQARLKSLLSELDPRTHTVTAIFLLDKPDGELWVGQSARLKLNRRITMRGFWLPITALTESRRGLWSSYVLEPSTRGTEVMRIARHELQVLHSESERAFVRGTLREGDRVVATGLHRLVPEQLVRVLPDETIHLSSR